MEHSSIRYQQNREYFKTLNLLRYHQKQNHADKVESLTAKLNTIQYVKTPRTPSKTSSSEYSRLTSRRARLLNTIRLKQSNNEDITSNVEQLKDIIQSIDAIPADKKPLPKLVTTKAKNNAEFIQQLMSAR